MFVENHHVHEVANARVLPVTEVLVHRVELLGGVALHVDDLDRRGADVCEGERVGERNGVRVR